MRVGTTSIGAAELNAQRHIGINQSNLAKSLERLSSGMSVNRAADDAAGLAVSETIRTQVRGLAQGSANSEDGMNLLKTADGGLQEMQNMLQRMRELVVQAANQTYTDQDRQKIQGEISQLTKNFDEISVNTEFNGIKLLHSGIGFQDGSDGFFLGINPGSPTIPATPTINAVFSATIPAVPAVFGPPTPTVVDTVADYFQSVGVQNQPAGVTILAGSLGGLAMDANGDIYVAGSEPASGIPPSGNNHAIIKITSGGAVNTNFAVTPALVGTGMAFDPLNGNLYMTANATAAARVLQVTPTGVVTSIHNGSNGANLPPVVFGTGIGVNPTTGAVIFGTASPLYSGGFAPSTETNNIYQVTGPVSHIGLLGDPGTPVLPVDALTGPLLHNNTGFPNNNHEQGGLPNSSTPGTPNPNGDNVFIQDLAVTGTGTIFFTSRMTAPFEADINGSVPVAPGAAFADGKLFMATPAAGGGTNIVQIAIAGNPPRLGGVAVDPITGDLLIADRTPLANTIRRITNPGLPGQTESTITIVPNVPVVGISFVTTPSAPNYGRAYFTTVTNNNDIYTLDPPIPQVPGALITPTIPAVPSMLISATIPSTPMIPAVPASTGAWVYTDGSLHVQTGANEAQDIRVKLTDMGLSSMKLEGIDISLWGTNPYGNASTDQYVSDVSYDMQRIDDALSKISTVRATFGAYLNRMEHAKSNADNAGIQQAASDSRIRDTDMAKETSELVRQQILTQASTDMLGQIQKVNGQLVLGLIKS